MNADIIGRYLEGEPHRIQVADKDSTVYFSEDLPYLDTRIMSRKGAE
jgi:hypothetical protein